MTPNPSPAPPPGSPANGNHTGPFWLRAALILLILLGIFLTAFFGARTIRSYGTLRMSRRPPSLTDVTMIRSWMTVPYIARAYHVPETLLWQGLGIPEPLNRRKSLRVLNLEYFSAQPDAVISDIREIIRAYQAAHPTPTPTVPIPGGPGV